MSVSLTYVSEEPVSPDVLDSIKRQAARLNETRDWWCEGLVIFESAEFPGHVVGDTKLFASGYSRADGTWEQVDVGDDSFMAWRDAKFIVACLVSWASEYDLVWQLSMEGADLGGIGPTGADPSIEDFFAVLALESGHPTFDSAVVESTAEGILQKYPAR